MGLLPSCWTLELCGAHQRGHHIPVLSQPRQQAAGCSWAGRGTKLLSSGNVSGIAAPLASTRGARRPGGTW